MGQLQIAWAVGHAVVVVQETCDNCSVGIAREICDIGFGCSYCFVGVSQLDEEIRIVVSVQLSGTT